MADVCVMVSGGLDSTVALATARILELGCVHALHVDLGEPYEAMQRERLDRLGVSYESLDLSQWRKHAQGHNAIVAGRNLVLAQAGACRAPRVWICALDGEQFGQERDKSVGFYGIASALLSHTMQLWWDAVTVESPFYWMTKAAVVRAGIRLIGLDAMLATRSCYSSDDEAQCGECLTCYKRWAAFKLNGIEEEGYRVHPSTCQYAKELDRRMRSKQALLLFSPNRIEEWHQLSKLLDGDGP